MSQELCRAGIDLCLPSREFLIVGAQRRASEVREKARSQASLILLGKLVYIRQQVGQRLHGIILHKTRDSVNLWGERFGSGDGEREASMTGQMPFKALAASVFQHPLHQAPPTKAPSRAASAAPMRIDRRSPVVRRSRVRKTPEITAQCVIEAHEPNTRLIVRFGWYCRACPTMGALAGSFVAAMHHGMFSIGCECCFVMMAGGWE